MKAWRLPFSFPRLLTRLGLAQPDASFDLGNLVMPVSIVDADITIPASFTPPAYGTPASAGELAAPVNGTRLADTGQLAGGLWYVQGMVSNNTGNISFRFKKRNAADAADVWSQFLMSTTTQSIFIPPMLVSVVNLERLCIEMAANSAGTVQGNIFAALVQAA